MRVVRGEYQLSMLIDLSCTDKAFLKAQKPVYLELGGTWAGITIPQKQVRVQDNELLVVAIPRAVPASSIKQLTILWPEAITTRLRGLLWSLRVPGYRHNILPGTVKHPQPR